jgi:biofilm protein TabA
MGNVNSNTKSIVKILPAIYIILGFLSCSESTMKGKSMITDQLKNAENYYSMHPDFERAFSFLRMDSLANLPAGKHQIDGDRIFAIVQKTNGRSRAEAKLEAHRKYIDIQYVISGPEEMGWRPTAACKSVESPYDESKDIGFFNDEPETWTKVEAGHFAIFTPEDAHAPLVSSGEIHKVVIKVRVSE